MKLTNLLGNLKFGSMERHAEPLHADRNGRAILITLKSDQYIREHNASSSQFFAVVLRGRGTLAGGDNVEHICRPNTFLVFDPGENHFIRALEKLVFVGILNGSPLAQKLQPALKGIFRRQIKGFIGFDL